MDQRPLRLGDILDDYCPRERRLTNHAVVAMIDDAVKQTRCTTCDAEHVYKGGRLPRRRTKDSPATLYKEVLAGMPDADETPALSAAAPGNIVHVPDLPVAPVAAAIDGAEEPGPDSESADPEPEPSVREDGPVHRQLLRAKLPRPEGQKDARPLPEFTVRQAASRTNGHFRGDRSKGRGPDPRATAGRGGSGNGNSANGNRAHGGGRFQGSRPGGGQHRNPGGRGPQNPFRGGQQRHGGVGGKKGRG